MKRKHILTHPTKLSDLMAEDLFADNDVQQFKARSLELRRWRTLKRAIRGDSHAGY